jgi:hypothetical protein
MYSKNMKSIRVPPVAWHFIFSARSDVTLCQGSKQSTKRALGIGLLHSSVKCSCETTLLQFETEEDIHTLVFLFGGTSIVDIRNRKPKHGQQSKELSRNDAINVKVGSNEREDPFICYTNRDGVYFQYDGEELVMRVRYCLYLLQRIQATGDLVDCPINLLRNLINMRTAAANNDELDSDNLDSLSINEGDEFTSQERIYRVLEVHRHSHILAKCIFPIENNPTSNRVIQFDDVEH